jgi:SAM-dependent methyltransferase
MKRFKLNPWDNEYQKSEQAPIYKPLWNSLERFLKSIHGDSVLDYGCGDGNYSNLIYKLGFNVTGIDVSSNAIKIANNAKCSGKLSFLTASSIPENIHDNSFDVVVMLNVLHCLSNKDRYNLLQQTKCVLKNNGYLFASLLSTNDESYPRHEWEEVENGTFDDGSGKLFHFFNLDDITCEFRDLSIIRTELLENIHPDVGRKSSLHIVVCQMKNKKS